MQPFCHLFCEGPTVELVPRTMTSHQPEEAITKEIGEQRAMDELSGAAKGGNGLKVDVEMGREPIDLARINRVYRYCVCRHRHGDCSLIQQIGSSTGGSSLHFGSFISSVHLSARISVLRRQ